MTTVERKRAAPYVPASTLSQFFDHIRYVREPSEVDAGLLEDYGIKRGQVFALGSTLKFLGVIDDNGKPTPVFRELQTGGDEFRDALRGVIERAYEDLFNRLDVSRDTKDKINNFFARNYSPATAERATRLFLDICGEAGIETASQPRKADRKQAQASRSTPKRSLQEPRQASRQAKPQDHGGVGEQEPPDTPKDIRQEAGWGPNIDIRINSQDLAGMDASQISAIFSGLAGLVSRDIPQQLVETVGDDAEASNQLVEVQEDIPSLTPEALELLETVDAGGIPMFPTPHLQQIASENGIPFTSETTPDELIEALRAKAAK